MLEPSLRYGRREEDGKRGRGSRYSLVQGPDAFPVYNSPGILHPLFKGKISRDPFKIPPSHFAGSPLGPPGSRENVVIHRFDVECRLRMKNRAP